MLLTMMIMLAIASTIVEMMFAAKIPAWRKNAHKLKWVNMVISIILSFVLGLAFGAAGIIALGAAMISTVLSIPGYAFLHWNYDSPQAIKGGAPVLDQYRNNISSQIERTKKLFVDLCKLFYFIGKVITFPFWLPAKISTAFKEATSRTPTTTP
jgi:hypothetical protein